MAQNGQAALDWGRHEGEILDLFVSQNKTLNEVMSHMKDRHNFQATPRQYKFRFPNLKNVKAEEWIWINQEMQRRAALGQESEPRLYDRPLPLDRVIRGITRHGDQAHATIPVNQVLNPSPGRISVRTPPPIVAAASGLGLSPLNDLMDNHVESCAPQVSVEESPTQQLPLEVAFVREQMVELDDAMEIETEIEANLFRLDLSNRWDFGGDNDFHWPTVNCLSPAAIMRRNPSFDANGSPRLQSEGQWLSPFSQFINLEIFDARPGFQLMTNLPWFRLQSMLEQPEYTLQIHPMLDGVLLSPTNTSIGLSTEAREDVLSSLLGLKSELQLAKNTAQVTSKLQRLVPERYEGELSDKVGKILDARSANSSNLSLIFGLAAYFASNNTLGVSRTDTFLRWVIDQTYADHLERFLQINTPTIHSFASQILNSAARIKNVKFLRALLNHGVKFDSVLEDILLIGDMEFMKLVLSKVDLTCLKETTGVRLFHDLVNGNHFDLARMLVQNGVLVDCRLDDATPLYSAVSNKNVHKVRFLLDLGANVNCIISRRKISTALERAVLCKDPEIVALLLEHGANISSTVAGEDLLEWSSLNCRNIYSLLKENVGSIAVSVTVGDLVDAAKQSEHSLRGFISRHQGQVSKHQLEKALNESIRLGHLAATVALLRQGVSPDCHTLNTRPLLTALDTKEQSHRFCKLLISFGADVNVPRILRNAIRNDNFGLFQTLIMAGVNLEEQGMEALVESAMRGHVTSAAFLLDSGVDIDTLGLKMNPLQTAAIEANLEMVEFLLTRGADINAPAYPDGGRTALQSALRCMQSLKVARLLLRKGADVSAPPALVGGETALEAICNGFFYSIEGCIALCNQLLDAGASVNRPNGKPSSVLHGVIGKGWDEILARILEPQRNAVIDYMWCEEELEEDEYEWEPRTPTQLAAGYGRFKAVKMLLDRGADINEAPAYQFGRTALQAVASRASPEMELVQLLFERGADINAKPAVHGGITALQGAAISGDITLAKLLLDKGADVNAAPSFIDGRYAIEGAAEHGRLDMVQLLMNAGAMGNVFRGTGFEYAIKLAEENDHFVIANLLKNETIVFPC